MRDGKEGPAELGRASDQQLVEACIAGSETAWETLIERYRSLVYSVCLNYTKSAEDAADVYQEVWAQAHLKLATVRDARSIRSWLITVTRNICYHWQTKKKSRASREQGGYETDELDLRGSVLPPDLGEIEDHRRLQEAVSKLSPRCQALIRLLFFRQPPLKYKDVAVRLELAVGSVPFIRARCLEKLHRLLEADESTAKDKHRAN